MTEGRVLCVSFTRTTAVMKMLMLTSIDRTEGLFTPESITKFAWRGTDPYFVRSFLPLQHGEQRLGEASMSEGPWNLDFRDVSHT